MQAIKKRMVQVVVRVPKEYADLAKEIGRKEYRSYASVLRRAIIEWLNEHKKGGTK